MLEPQRFMPPTVIRRLAGPGFKDYADRIAAESFEDALEIPIGTLAGIVTMVHHMCGGLGAYIGAVSFDLGGGYERAFVVMLITSGLALALSLWLAKVPPRAITGAS